LFIPKLLAREAEKQRVPPLSKARHLSHLPEYRRNRVPGGSYFFTVNLRDRGSDLLVVQIDALRNAVRQVRTKSPFHINASVVLSEHMHCIWMLPDNDTA
jgi:putative transposase